MDHKISVQRYSGMSLDGPDDEGFAVVRHADGSPIEIVAVYATAEQAEEAAERLRDKGRKRG